MLSASLSKAIHSFIHSILIFWFAVFRQAVWTTTARNRRCPKVKGHCTTSHKGQSQTFSASCLSATRTIFTWPTPSHRTSWTRPTWASRPNNRVTMATQTRAVLHLSNLHIYDGDFASLCVTVMNSGVNGKWYGIFFFFFFFSLMTSFRLLVYRTEMWWQNESIFSWRKPMCGMCR